MRLFFLFAAAAAFLTAQEPQSPPAASPPKTAKPAADPQARFREMIRNFMGLAPAPDAAAVDRGQAAFVANCAFCHGSNANGGNSGPDLVRSVLVLHDEGTGTGIGPVILNGRTDKGMPKFSMTPDQIKDIAAFLLSRNQAAANRMEYKIQNVVTGDAHVGETYFSAHCASCHSATGDLEHVATKYDPVALQSRFLYPETRRYPGMPGPPPDPRGQTTVTVTPASGEKVSGVLLWIDDFNVSLTDSAGQRHSFALGDGSGVTAEVHDPLKGHEELLKKYTDADMHNILAYLETMK